VSRVTSILKRAVNRIFTVSPDTQPDNTAPDSDIEALGYMVPPSDLKSMSDYYQKGELSPYDWYLDQLKIELKKEKLYDVFEEMDRESPELSSALDIYADNACQSDNDWEPVIKIDTTNDTVKKLLTDFIDMVKLNDNVWTIARNLVKFGEDYEELVLDKALKPRRIKNLKGKFMVRNEDEFQRLREEAFLQKSESDMTRTVATFKKWQITHFRMTKNRTKKYGVEGSILFPAIKVYRQLSMMEDSMVIARLSRAPMKYAYMIDVEGMDAETAKKHVDEVKKSLKKRRTVDAKTGKQDLKYNPLSAEEDIFMGTTQKGKADVKVLQGDNNISNIKDVYYFQRKLFSTTKVPKAYLGLEEDVNAKGTVTEQEIQFARTVRRVQMTIIAGLKEMFDTVLILEGISPTTNMYRIILPAISMVDELRKWQARLVKMQVATLYKQNFMVNTEYLMRVFLNMTDDEIQEVMNNQDQMMADLLKAQVDLAKNTASAPQQNANSGGGGVKSMGGMGNKPPSKKPTDTKHNASNSANRKTQRQAGLKQTASTEYTDAELLNILFTEEITDQDVLLDAVEALKRKNPDFFSLEHVYESTHAE